VQACRAAGSEVVLLAVRANPTLGPDYAAAFDAIWPTIAREHGLPLVPFVLEGFADAPSLLQADGLHPTAEGHDRIAALVLPALEPVVRALPPR
jgi:acyl-CoA thioesterase I